MRAISSFNFDAGMSTRECLAETALRIRANMSAIGSVIRYNSIFDCQLPIADCRLKQLEIGNRKSAMLLPTTFHDARNLPGERQFAKTDAAQVKLAQVRPGPTTSPATGISARRELRLPISFRD